MTIVLSNKKEISAIGTQTNKNCKPVFCITTGEIYASVTDAAKANNVHISSITGAMTGKCKTVNGKKFCLLSKCAEHMDEISDMIQTRHAKAVAYDTIMARQEAVRKANETLAKRKANYIKLHQELTKAQQLLTEAEAEVARLQN